jgi:hypothetical protein
MREAASVLISGPLYLSALLIWPICVIAGRRKRDWRHVRRMFLRCLFVQLLLIALAVLPFKIVDHPYEWFFVMLFVNILFTVLGLRAITKDRQSDV